MAEIITGLSLKIIIQKLLKTNTNIWKMARLALQVPIYILCQSDIKHKRYPKFGNYEE